MEVKERKALIVGDKLMALHDEKLFDHVTKVSGTGFYILNDNGVECFPIGVRFKIISE